MLTSSCKAKGRKLASWFKERLLSRFPSLGGADIVVTSAGTTGEDLQFSPAARKLFPFQIEAKNLARAAIYVAYDQACEHGDYTPIVLLKSNRRDPLIIIDAEHFLDLIQRTQK